MSITVTCPRCGKAGTASGASRVVHCSRCGARFKVTPARVAADTGPACERLGKPGAGFRAYLVLAAVILAALLGWWVLRQTR
jgi:hypothetical protein